jgi:hypothetical protein
MYKLGSEPQMRLPKKPAPVYAVFLFRSIAETSYSLDSVSEGRVPNPKSYQMNVMLKDVSA